MSQVNTPNWKWTTAANDATNYGVFSHYNYRLVCIFANDKPGFYSGEARKMTIYFTKPLQLQELGNPMFKTQKQLQGRSLVTDSFDKPATLDAGEPGYGIFGHREGYNALYGDYSVSWQGDPQQRFMYMGWVNHNMSILSGNCVYYGISSADANIDPNIRWMRGGTTYTSVDPAKYQWRIWHEMDVAHAIDVDGTVGSNEITPF